MSYFQPNASLFFKSSSLFLYVPSKVVLQYLTIHFKLFWNKIFVESQDSGSDVVEAAHEEIVPTMVEQIERNQLFNTFIIFRI